jgi:uncharacterized protein YcbK (DUF882 family)
MTLPIRLVAAVAIILVPAIAGASSASSRMRAKLHRNHARIARASHGCVSSPVEIVTVESASFSLARCDGTAIPAAVEHLSKLLAAPSGHRLDARLVAQLQAAADHFRDRETPRVVLLSAYKPASEGNYHSTGRALDFRIDGIKDDALFAFCKTLPDTGCGYYPDSSFVHMDVRAPGTGHVAWTDASHSGEAPRSVVGEAPETPSLPPLPPAP